MAHPLHEEPFATTVIRAAGSGAPIVVLSPTADELHLPPSIVELLQADGGSTRAVVPMVVSEARALLEAGANVREGRLEPRGRGRDPRAANYLSRRHVTGSTYSWLALRGADIIAANLPPREGDASVVVGALLTHVQSGGGEVVYEPGWVVEAPNALGAPAVDRTCLSQAARSSSANSMLVVTGGLPRDALTGLDRFAHQVITSLIDVCSHGELTVLATGHHLSDRRLASYRSQGAEVHAAPADFQRWFTDRFGSFSHVVLLDAAARTSAQHWLSTTQPQATCIVAFSALPFRDVESLRPITPTDELPGLEWVLTSVEAEITSLSRSADTIWCERADDLDYLRALLPGKSVAHLVNRLDPPRASIEFEQRRGVVIFADDGSNVLQANEDAAVRALSEVVPWLRRRLASLDVSVVATAPSPLLSQSCKRAGASIVDSSLGTEVASRARLVIVAHQFGSGGRRCIQRSLDARTPFIATPLAAEGLELGVLGPEVKFAHTFDIAQRSLQLLTQGDHWGELARMVDTLAQPVDTASFELHLGDLGFEVRRGGSGVPAGEVISPPPFVAPSIALRVGGDPPETAPGSNEGETDESRRYERWRRQFGADGAALDALRDAAHSAAYQPLISIVMPVYNTDPEILQEAIQSVRNQVYDNWQLCIADDGSTSPGTQRVLERLATIPSVKLRHLGGKSGISGASNAAMKLATGDFVCFVDHDDVLKPHALAQIVRWLNADPTIDLLYSDEDKIDQDGRLFQPHIKPDWSPNHLMSQNFVCHLLTIRRSLIEMVGGFRSVCDGSQDWDLVLRVSELTDRIAHIPEPLYSWRIVPGSAAATPTAKPYALTAAKIALKDALDRRHLSGQAVDGLKDGLFRTRYAIAGRPRVTIIIPTRDGIDLLRRCINSIHERSTYENYELLVIDNQSSDPETLGYLAELPATVVRYPHLFNYARMMNLAAHSATGDALLFLNNDTEVRSPDWIEALLEHAMRPEVGAVGGRLYFGDGRLQHEGILVGVFGGWAANVDHGGYFSRGDIVRDTSAVTGACTMIRPDVYWRVGGNDERLRVAYNDVDLCLRIRQAGYQVVYTPYAELFHYESATRSGYEHHEDGPLFGVRWRPKELVDPFYSPMFARRWPFKIAE